MATCRSICTATALLLATGACSPGGDGGSGAPASPQTAAKPLAVTRVKSKGGTMVVSSPVFADGAPIPDIYTGYGQGAPPPVMWTPVANAKSYAVVIEDPDAPGRSPYVHWIVYQIATTTSALDDQTQGGALPAGALQGRASSGAQAYAPPKPPKGDKAHHYYLEVFALDTTPGLAKTPNLADLEQAMKGHVLASGETVGVYAANTTTPPAPEGGATN
jgi:Raf kinase inhibitor-like YbhB/YbcL family protein